MASLSKPTNSRTLGSCSSGREALDLLLFHQYGNYVAQCVLTVSIDVLLGRREGRKEWFFAVRQKIVDAEPLLENYTSGKKILGVLLPYRHLPSYC